MSELIGECCVGYRREAPSVTQEEILMLHPIIPNWNVIQEIQTPKLDRSFRLQDFSTAFYFTNADGELQANQDITQELLPNVVKCV